MISLSNACPFSPTWSRSMGSIVPGDFLAKNCSQLLSDRQWKLEKQGAQGQILSPKTALLSGPRKGSPPFNFNLKALVLGLFSGSKNGVVNFIFLNRFGVFLSENNGFKSVCLC